MSARARFALKYLPAVGAAMLALAALVAVRSDIGAEEVATVQPSGTAAVEKPKTEPTDVRNAKGSRVRGGPMPAFTPEREAAALTFVAAHHAELTPLLNHLKKSRPSDYQKAIRKLFNDSERLAHSREQQPLRYELELQSWKLESRIQLLVARMTMEKSAKLEGELRKALSEQLDLRRALLTLERDRMRERAEVLDKEIAQLEANREQRLDEEFDRAVRSTGKKNKD
jgi:hypothetical protein